MTLKERIQNLALSEGFTHCKVAKSTYLHEEEKILKQWLADGNHADMDYLKNYTHLRVNPQNIVAEAKSVIVLTQNYYPKQHTENEQVPHIAYYARGCDYHKVIRKKLKRIADYILRESKTLEIRYFIDSGPVLERTWAERAGVGWIGKNSMLINPQTGSYMFLSVIITQVELESDSPLTDRCGTCTRCTNACPTSAILDNRTIDARKCISLHTQAPIHDTNKEYKLANQLLGCDICQKICPWNRKPLATSEQEFDSHPEYFKLTRNDYFSMPEHQFNRIFDNKMLGNKGWKIFKRNIEKL